MADAGSARSEHPDTSGHALAEHWTWAASKGLMNQNTARTLRAAVNQVLSIEDDPDAVDITKLDVEQLLHRWETLRKREFKPETLETYKQRFRQAVAGYTSYLKDPGGWRPASPKATSAKQAGKPKTDKEVPGASVQTVEALRLGNVVDFPFPLRDGVIAHLRLPLDLKPVEVKRLTAFMNTLVVDETNAS